MLKIGVHEKTITFRGKEISRLEAEIFIHKLESGAISPDLNENERADYESIKNAEIFRILNPKIKELTGKEYLIGELKRGVNMLTKLEISEYCDQHGCVPDSKSRAIGAGQSGAKSYVTCKRCGSRYEEMFLDADAIQRNLNTIVRHNSENRANLKLI